MLKREIGHTGLYASLLGIGTAYVADRDPITIEKIYRKAFDGGINFVDLAGGGGSIFAPLGRAMEGRREDIILQVHLGALYAEDGSYGWSRDVSKIREMFEKELVLLKTDYVDFAMLHCIDDMDDLKAVLEGGILDYARELVKTGKARHIGFSSHTPEVAKALIETGIPEIMLFSINAAYDLEKGDEYGKGSFRQRRDLYELARDRGVGISVMKPFFGGQLLDEKRSPLGFALSKGQCLAYCLDCPGVCTLVPGVSSLEEVDELLAFDKDAPENDYSVLKGAVPKGGSVCVYCDHCLPCPVGLDIGLINKYYDLDLVGDPLAKGHYAKLTKKASLCIGCGHCDRRCPFGVKQSSRMRLIKEHFEG